MLKKYEKLKSIILSKKSLVVAFSGGVDSAFLLYVANQVLKDKALGITIQTPYVSDWEIKDAKEIAKEIGANHKIIKLPLLDELKNNPLLRCYICKHKLFSTLLEFAKNNNFLHVSEGSNVDDTHEYRPGRKALEELNISTPLLEANLSKSEIRKLSEKFGLSTWNKPSFACLLTRFEHDYILKSDEFKMVEKAEQYLIQNGYKQIRVRFKDGCAKIEMTKKDIQIFRNSQNSQKILDEIKDFGFLHVSLNTEKFLIKK